MENTATIAGAATDRVRVDTSPAFLFTLQSIQEQAATQFAAPEIRQDGQVTAGVVVKVADQVARLEVLTSTYSERRYLHAIRKVDTHVLAEELVMREERLVQVLTERGDGSLEAYRHEGVVIRNQDHAPIYLDPYHFHSVPIAAWTSEGIVGSARLIFKDHNLGLPTLNIPGVQFFPEWGDLIRLISVEYSQYARKAGAPDGTAVAVLRASVRISRALGITTWIATTDLLVQRLLNGFAAYLDFGLPLIAPQIEHLGSMSQPVLIEIGAAIEHSRSKANVDAADFIDGKPSVSGFDWYCGI